VGQWIGASGGPRLGNLEGILKKKKHIYIYSGGKTKKKLGINFYYYLIFFGKNS